MAFLYGGTSRSGTTVAGAKTIAAANIHRRGLHFQNVSDTAMRLTESGVAASSTSGFSIAAGGFFKVNTSNAISVYCASASKAYEATEF